MLYLWMPEGQGKWLWCTDDQTWQSAPTLEALIQTINISAPAKEATVFFPSQTAQFGEKSLTRQQYKQLGVQGVQYLLEENSIESIDHLAIFHHYAQNELHMMAIAKQTRETYQHSLALLPWQISALLPDFLLVAQPDAKQLRLMQIEDRIVWRWGAYRGWQCDDLSIMSVWLNQDIEMVTTANLSEENYALVLNQLQDNQQIQQSTVNVLNADLSRLKNHPFNALLKVKKPSQSSGYWRACIALFAVALMVQVLYDGLRWWKYKQIADQTAALAVNQYQQWFPNETRINEQNLSTQFTAKVRANASADVQALQLISRVGPILQQANISAQKVEYKENGLSLHLLARNSEHFQNLMEQFKQQGFNAELGAIQNQGSDVVGVIKVQ